MTAPSLYQQVTAALVAELDRGVAPWVQPWSAAPRRLPYNAATGHRYQGVNVLLLWQAAWVKGYPSPAWIGYDQARRLGGYIQREEKATPIVYGSRYLPARERDKPAAEQRWVPFLKPRHVFNLAQTANLPPRCHPVEDAKPLPVALAEAETFLKTLGANVLHGGDRAFYAPRLDLIVLPEPARFHTTGDYVATSLHEHGHWSGHPSRLHRDFSGRFSDRSYAEEELVAELTAAYLCARLAVPGQLRHAEYLGHWVDLLKADAQAIFTAAARATEAARYLEQQGGLPSEDATSEDDEALVTATETTLPEAA